MPVVANSVTKTPPPAAANSAPYEAVSLSVTEHPLLSLAVYRQSVALTDPLRSDDVTEQPDSVWADMRLLDWALTPSNVSISPPAGHVTSAPVDQKAGQTEHPYGRLSASRTHTLPISYDAVDSSRTELRFRL